MTAILHHLTRQQIVYSFDKDHTPVLEINSGDLVRFETFDARSGTIQHNSDLLDHPHPIGSNPATGPVYIRDAEPGDTLCVEILAIDLADKGFLAVKAGEGLLAHKAPNYATRIVEVRDQMVIFNERIRFPAQPMVGVIGTAPDGDGVSTGFAGSHGGNMDNRYLTTGAKLYLPVQVPGALWGLGDVHGAMGDGEITFIGLEICAEVTVKAELIKRDHRRRPLIETPRHWVTTGEDLDLGQAARQAAESMVELIQQKGDLSFEDAYMLMSGTVDVQICQCCEPGEFPTTARAVLDKALIS
jgi:amidase